MTALYSNKAETLTSRNIVDAYRSAYFSVHNAMPDECAHLNGKWFVINGVERDRGWLILEIERLRQEAIAKALEKDENSSRGRLFKVLRRLSRI